MERSGSVCSQPKMLWNSCLTWHDMQGSKFKTFTTHLWPLWRKKCDNSAAILQFNADRLCEDEHLVLTSCRTQMSSLTSLLSLKNQTWKIKKKVILKFNRCAWNNFCTSTFWPRPGGAASPPHQPPRALGIAVGELSTASLAHFVFPLQHDSSSFSAGLQVLHILSFSYSNHQQQVLCVRSLSICCWERMRVEECGDIVSFPPKKEQRLEKLSWQMAIEFCDTFEANPNSPHSICGSENRFVHWFLAPLGVSFGVVEPRGCRQLQHPVAPSGFFQTSKHSHAWPGSMLSIDR